MLVLFSSCILQLSDCDMQNDTCKKMFTTESPEEYTAEFFCPHISTHQADVKVKGAVYLVNLSTPALPLALPLVP